MFALIALLDIQPPIKHRIMIMEVIEKIMRHCHPLVLPVLFSSPATLIHGIVTSVDACQHDFERQADLGDMSSLIDAEDCLCSIVNLLVVLFKFAHEVQRRTLHTAGGRALLTAYSRAASMCQLFAARDLGMVPDTGKNSRAVAAFGTLGGYIYIDCLDIRNLDINSEAARLFDEYAKAVRVAEIGNWERLIRLFYYLESLQQCAAPGCSTTVVDGPLWRCAGCRWVTYCLRGCRKRAWRHSIPHRSICGVISQLQTDLGIPHRNVAATPRLQQPPCVDDRAGFLS
jgi:hypothetical protein